MAFRIKLNSRGVREVLRSPGVLADLERRAEAVKRAAGPGHEVEVEVGAKRARAAVVTATAAARRSEATNRTLTRAFGAARR